LVKREETEKPLVLNIGKGRERILSQGRKNKKAMMKRVKGETPMPKLLKKRT